ncbi:hypothetical protein [Microvirga ossetica]|uniref:hypothetical protein n=1 Tax=Microvirga ossetica TaxID=1882682 RepID=UPI00130015CE|nr:hypothetical protein [Microvirga ossetica]
MTVSLVDVQNSIKSLIRQNRINSLIYSLLIPVIVGVYCTFYDKLVAVHPLLFWGPVLMFVLFALVTAYYTYDVKLAPEIYLEMEDAYDRIEKLEGNTRFLNVLQEQSLSWGIIVRNHIHDQTRTPEYLKETIREILSLIVEDRERLFDFDASELWSFSVYVYDTRDGLLHPIWRDKHRKHPSSGPGRLWAPGRGHVGIAFAQCVPKICPDAYAPGVWEMFNSADQAEPHDSRAYASFVSEPIGPVGGKSHPYGVLVATSDTVGRFDIASALALRHAASAIATLIYLAYDQSDLEKVCDLAN